jgi:hypothetical protein
MINSPAFAGAGDEPIIVVGDSSLRASPDLSTSSAWPDEPG